MKQGALASLVERGLKWSAVTTVGRFALQLGAQVALARLLGPGNYGIYGIGLTVLTFATFLAGSSFSYTLMLQPAVTRDDIRFAFTWQMLAGVATAVAMYLGAPALASFFGEPAVEAMVQWLALAAILTAAAAPATCLLQRDLNFRALGLIQMAAYGAGYLAIGVPLALSGAGAMALAAACIVQAAVTLVGTYAVRPHSLRPLLTHPEAAATLTTGRAVFLTNIVNWLLGNIDRVIIGRVLNAQAVGLYTLAYNLAQIPNALLLGAFQPAFLASGAKINDDPARLARAWLLVLACVLVLVTPVAIVLALLSGDLVRLLYGPAWAESAWVLAVLFLCIPAWACWGLSTPVLWNTGRKHYEALLQIPVLALAIPAWWLLSPGGIRAAAMVSALVIFGRAVVIIGAGLHALKLRWSAVLPFALRGLLLGAICTAAVLLGQRSVASISFPGVALSAGGAAALLVMLLLVATMPQILGSDARSALARLLPGVAEPPAPTDPGAPR